MLDLFFSTSIRKLQKKIKSQSLPPHPVVNLSGLVLLIVGLEPSLGVA